jgi:hypothetical protein
MLLVAVAPEATALTLAVKSPVNSMPSRFTVVKPGSVKVTV